MLLLVNLSDAHDSSVVWKKIVSVVGNFDIDPDRVLDLIVDPKIHQQAPNNCLQLLLNFRSQSIVAILGNKLKMIGDKPIEAEIFQKLVYCGSIETGSLEQLHGQLPLIPSPSLVSLAAKLIKQGIIEYKNLAQYLDPPDHIIKSLNSKRNALTMKKVTTCYTLNTEETTEDEKNKLEME